MARAFLTEDDIAQAYDRVERILPYLESGNFHGPREPIRIYLTCYQVLLAKQDNRAPELLDAAHSQLNAWASKIEDVHRRQSFLENIRAHQAVQKLWAEEIR